MPTCQFQLGKGARILESLHELMIGDCQLYLCISLHSCKTRLWIPYLGKCCDSLSSFRRSSWSLSVPCSMFTRKICALMFPISGLAATSFPVSSGLC